MQTAAAATTTRCVTVGMIEENVNVVNFFGTWGSKCQMCPLPKRTTDAAKAKLKNTFTSGSLIAHAREILYFSIEAMCFDVILPIETETLPKILLNHVHVVS